MVKNPAEKNLNLITKAQTTINGTPIKVAINVKDPLKAMITIWAENFISFPGFFFDVSDAFWYYFFLIINQT